ncbi:uncharacterized protein LOC131145419 [Malania oleifera]|uniref:uncharacterized protein LOC131145419 n=1 Tax=Malania oleifera TaxID=397392 RepID=UPI0025AE3AA3|nr:uncharacterized protein LOC131145419 [Malania oleifera]XP_057950447.1 uncharacterized protein LOC131145419 [Malania oleifera]XP_057950448.1 uncharacterized protein LOC131145419 [Malania oleifera]
MRLPRSFQMKQAHDLALQLQGSAGVPISVQISHETRSKSFSSKKRRVTEDYVDYIQMQIELCLQNCMNRNQTIEILSDQAEIIPAHTTAIWKVLEEENAEFFEAYYLKLIVKKQIGVFNQLLARHCSQKQSQNLQLYHMQNAVYPLFDWEQLEKDNAELFEVYKLKLMLMVQICTFNELLENHRNLMNSQNVPLDHTKNTFDPADIWDRLKEKYAKFRKDTKMFITKQHIRRINQSLVTYCSRQNSQNVPLDHTQNINHPVSSLWCLPPDSDILHSSTTSSDWVLFCLHL